MTQATAIERGGLAVIADPQKAEQYIEQLERAREALIRGGYDTLAVTAPEDSPAYTLARELGGLVLDPQDNYPETLMASSHVRRYETGRIIASILPLQVRGEPKCVPYEDGDSRSTLAAIMESRSRVVTGKIDLPYVLDDGSQTSVAMAIVSNYNGNNI